MSGEDRLTDCLLLANAPNGLRRESHHRGKTCLVKSPHGFGIDRASFVQIGHVLMDSSQGRTPIGPWVVFLCVVRFAMVALLCSDDWCDSVLFLRLADALRLRLDLRQHFLSNQLRHLLLGKSEVASLK